MGHRWQYGACALHVRYHRLDAPRICNTYCFSSATIVAQKHHGVTLYVHCLFLCNNSCMKAPWCYIICTLPVLSELFSSILLLNSWPFCPHSAPIWDFINSPYSGTRIHTSRHMGQRLSFESLSCPQSWWPWTWPQFKYTYGCCFSFTVSSLMLRVSLRGITSVFSPTGHCGRPAFNSSTSVSRWCLVWNTGI